MSHTATTAHYWDNVVHYIRSAFGLFGEPEQLARQTWFTHKEHKLCGEFLRPLEALIRRLIFIAALELQPMTHPRLPEKKFRAPRACDHERPIENIDNAASWRVSFQLLANCRARKKSRERKPKRTWAGGPMPDVVFTASSAARLEAITRAYKARDKLAANLARRIAQNTAIARNVITSRPNNKLATKPVFDTLFEIVPLAQEAYQAWIARRLARTDSS